MRARCTLVVATMTVLSGSGCGCGVSHTPPSPDAGGLDATRADAVSLDAGLRDAPAYDGPIDCSEVAGYRRCDERCPEPCPDRIRCPTYVPLCMSYEETFEHGSCGYDVGDLVGSLKPCDDGRPCAVPGDPPAEDDQHGMCVPLRVCLEGQDAGLPPFHCVWSDMTPVTRAPPDDPCPPSSDARAPFCSGTCGEVACPVPLCFGLSDTRAFGVCMWTGWPCWETAGSYLAARMDACRRELGEPCACLLLFPQPAEAPFPRGYFTLASACLAYDDVYPDGVECRDADWQEIIR